MKSITSVILLAVIALPGYSESLTEFNSSLDKSINLISDGKYGEATQILSGLTGSPDPQMQKLASVMEANRKEAEQKFGTFTSFKLISRFSDDNFCKSIWLERYAGNAVIWSIQGYNNGKSWCMVSLNWEKSVKYFDVINVVSGSLKDLSKLKEDKEVTPP